MELEQLATSFGRIRSDGHFAICEAKPVEGKESDSLKGSVRTLPLAEWLWTVPVQDSIPWPDLSALAIIPWPHPDGKDKCGECKGRGSVECYACGHDEDCEYCDGTGKAECSCVGGFGDRLRLRPAPMSLGDFKGENGEAVGVNPLYLEAIRDSIGPVTAMWYGHIQESRSFAFFCAGERGRAVIMPYRMNR